MPYPSLLGQVVKAERGRIKMDQGSMAASLGLSQSAYSRLESGEATMNVWQLRQCAHQLGKSVAELMRVVDRYETQILQQGIEVVAERKTNPGAALIGLAILAAVLTSK
jgi:transcriptional regulator with XRE-family HTH domain